MTDGIAAENKALVRRFYSGRPIALKGIAIYRVEGGKLMERWVVSDLQGLLEEIGAPAPR
jgi:hypothetical protein